LARLQFPATQRNRIPILEVLKGRVAEGAEVLEIGCGSGEHAAFFAEQLPIRSWLPTDLDPAHIASAAAWCAGLPQVQTPKLLDVTTDEWPVEQVDVVFSANMIHIAPWEASLGLLRGAGRILRAGGLLILYGPFQESGVHNSPSNEAFDADLRRRDPSWGVRDLAVLRRIAAEHGLRGEEEVAMPANNRVVVFRR
jgi:SAM-dependent methyltransferase